MDIRIQMDENSELTLVINDKLTISVSPEARPTGSCVFCGGTESVIRYKGRSVCTGCLDVPPFYQDEEEDC